MARPVSLIVDIGFATMNVPSEAPPMMTNSQGCQITERCPPIAAKPPRMQPRAMTIPMTKPTRSAPARITLQIVNWQALLQTELESTIDSQCSEIYDAGKNKLPRPSANGRNRVDPSNCSFIGKAPASYICESRERTPRQGPCSTLLSITMQ